MEGRRLALLVAAMSTRPGIYNLPEVARYLATVRRISVQEHFERHSVCYCVLYMQIQTYLVLAILML